MRSFEKKSVNYVRLALFFVLYSLCVVVGLGAILGFYYLIHSTGNDYYILSKAGISFVAMTFSSVIAYGIGDSIK